MEIGKFKHHRDYQGNCKRGDDGGMFVHRSLSSSESLTCQCQQSVSQSNDQSTNWSGQVNYSLLLSSYAKSLRLLNPSSVIDPEQFWQCFMLGTVIPTPMDSWTHAQQPFPMCPNLSELSRPSTVDIIITELRDIVRIVRSCCMIDATPGVFVTNHDACLSLSVVSSWTLHIHIIHSELWTISR